MAANRIEPTKDGADKLEKSPAPASSAAPAVAPAAGFKMWLPLIVTILAMPLLAWGVTSFILLPKLQHGLGFTAPAPTAGAPAAAAKTEPRKDTEPKQSFPMTKLLVNVANTMGQRYLMVSLSLVGSGTEFRTRLETRNDQLRDLASAALATKTMVDLDKPGIRNLIRGELIGAFNNVLGAGSVQDIYITEFAIQ